jgi:hypothetical protein
MKFKTIEWNREKLYEQIWAAPLRAVAREYGLSDVGLAKVCKKLKIPRPGLGYWRRKECGFKVNRPALPAVKSDLRAVSRVPVDPPPKPMQILDPSLPPLIVPAVTATVHPLVQQTARAFTGGRADQFGRLQAANWRLPRLDLRVTAAGLARALRFMDGLIKLLEANGMRLSVASEREPVATNIDVDGEQIKVVLKERVRGRKRDLTADEKRIHARAPEIYRQDFRWAYHPTDRFILEIESYTDGPRSWADAKNRKVEQCRDQIAHGILAAAAYAKRLRAEREVERVRRADEERLRLRQQAQIERLMENVANWEEAQRIRSYLAALRKSAEAQDGGLKEDSRIAQLLDWAHQYADELDPTNALEELDCADQEP